MSANVCPFCGAVRKPYNPMHREAYTCGTWCGGYPSDAEFLRHTQGRACIKAEREHLTKERDAAITRADMIQSQLDSSTLANEEGCEIIAELKARAKRLEEAGDAMAGIINSKSVLWTDDDLDAASNAWTKAKEGKP